ncbi:MAG: K(+)-transporting ATPase subunit F [Pseudomonadota bacterium]|nr:K(+)-transporting ATPase subunit F [Pseudomonadota bacterium]
MIYLIVALLRPEKF